MKQRFVLLLLAGALIMNGSGVQTDTETTVEAAEDSVKEETDSTGLAGNLNPEKIINTETNMDPVQEEIVDTETGENPVQESPTMMEEDFSSENEKREKDLEKPSSADSEKKVSEEGLEKQSSADSEKKVSIEKAENRNDVGENIGTEDTEEQEMDHAAAEEVEEQKKDTDTKDEDADQNIDHAAGEDVEIEKNDSDRKEKNTKSELPSQSLEEGDSDKKPEEAKEDRPVGNRAESNITGSNIMESKITESEKNEPQSTESKSDETKIGELTSTKPETGEMNSADPEKSKEKDDMIQSVRSQEELKRKERESSTEEQSAAKQKEQPAGEEKEPPTAEQKEKPAAEQTKERVTEQKEQPAAEQTKERGAEQKEKPSGERKEKPDEEQPEVTVPETYEQINTDKKEEKSGETGEQTTAVKVEETAVGAEEQKKVQQVLNTEKLKNMLDSARIGISENKDSNGKNKMVLRLEGTALEAAKPVKVKIQLIRENGTATGNAGGQENEILVTREIVPNRVSGTTEAAGAGNRATEEPWEMEILSREDTGKILQEIPDNDGYYRIAVTYEDEEGNTASRDIPFKVNRFGSVYVYSQSCKDLQDSYVRSVEEDLVISEYNPDRLVAKSLKVEIIRDGEPLEQVLCEVHSGEDDKQEDREKEKHKQENRKQEDRKGWYRYDYIISRKNFEKDGIYQVSVSSADEAGNKPDSMDYYQKPILFRVDSTNPEVNFIRQAERSMKVHAENILRYQAFDAIRLKNIRVLVDGKLHQEISEIPDVTNYQGTVRLTGLRKHKVQIVLTDMAGNSYRSEEQQVYGIPVWLYLIMGIFCAGAIGVSSLLVIFRKSKRLRLRGPRVIKP
ncbi:hypothetical protein [Bilifractor sp. HCP3S3_D3]|uniref:hypothetical protein n=1 Tax=Bilifractor sp. HCP3S3_D3 TaxID=3438907 RepID=UPI003F8C275B